MKILLSEHAGFCFGVRRAVDLLEKEIQRADKEIFTLGHIIHNEDFNESLARRGVRNIDTDDLDFLPENALVFVRTHGVPLSVLEKLDRKGIPCVDATCPFVKKIHNIVRLEEEKALSLKKEAVFVLLGDSNHPEVLGIVSCAKNFPVVVISGLNELEEYGRTASRDTYHVFLSQTTHSVSEWKKCCEYAEACFSDTAFYDTICNVTEIRQKDVRDIAGQSDLVVIVGGMSSSNTKKLVSVSKEICDTVHIRNARELPREKIKMNMTVGVSAGASTPDSVIKEVIETMSEIKNDEMSFEEMLNQTFKTIRTGEEVTGVVTSVFANEVHVDLGIKHTGILPSSEVADSESDLAANFHVGDEITVLVQKFNDPEGTVQVSKKRVDVRANWSKIQEAYESGATLSGKVSSVIKGGILVSDENQTYFVPASLTGSPKGASLDPMLGQEVAFKIVETDPVKKRAVASIREVLREEKKALEEKFWAEVAVDKVYTGKVKSITSYGAFVDLGGVDGMVHITELSWKKLKSPAEVVSVGDEITVFVKEINPETRKISLGHKTEDTNPWNILPEKYQAGDVATVKIVSLTTFGAFAELIPGIDGLIHISQIANRKIANPAEVLAVGDEVQVEVVDINYETRRVSLSMRSLLEQEEAGEEDAIVAENSEYLVENKDEATDAE
ncbi:MAG: bifunctional 4-hydroxy-3-methylbut-2-enyl diphosphate reductase/30S ribosomal protein S1 [Ruminococcaceae bacterium]|nr:bifunctional 4-hydroxy-3-methylbut-2-enyl diphosphate reductase/30S ribosomal protein S1 [Oscillospiraceae bacterium]